MVDHERFIRQCLDLAVRAGKNGNHSFGAVLVHDGKVIMTAGSTVNDDHDSTRHAELNLVTRSQRAFPQEVLRESTLYTSTAPCLTCTSVIWSAGISKIVYSVSYEAFHKLAPDPYIPCDEIYARLGTKLELTGPVLEEEGLKVYQYWKELPGWRMRKPT